MVSVKTAQVTISQSTTSKQSYIHIIVLFFFEIYISY